MPADPSMNLEEDLLPPAGGDALHEYPCRTPFVEFVTEHDEGLDASRDSSSFSPFRWENLLEEVGELWYSTIGLIECQYGDIRG